MNKRALMIALILAVVGALLMFLYIGRFEEEASGGERVRVLMAVAALEPGAVIDEESVSVREIPIAYVEDRAIKATEKGKVVGLRVGHKVEANQTMMWTDLAIATDERRDLSSLIQTGNRAVSIKAESGDKSYTMIRPGDYVDVIANMPANDLADKFNSVVLLQKVLTLAVGLETAPENLVDKKEEFRSREMVLTLSVNLQEAQLIALAGEKGHLVVALRNPTDQGVSDGIPDMPSSALANKTIREKIQASRKASGGPVKLEAVTPE